ncbi:MAG: hypothetical protein U0V03_01900 [Bacteroidia bacterium]
MFFKIVVSHVFSFAVPLNVSFALYADRKVSCTISSATSLLFTL